MSPFAAAPKWTMRGRHPGESLSRPGSAPGPGQYGEARDGWSSKHVRAPSASFGTGVRGEHVRAQAPGPGQYQLPRSASTPKFGFGSSQRPASAGGNNKAPGPGAYTLESTLGRHGVSIGSRLPSEAETKKDKAPGPGAYTPKHGADERTEPKFSFGTGSRPDLNPSGGKIPGPGTYTLPKTDPSQPRPPTFSMRPRREDPLRARASGGGAMYGPFTDMGRGPKYSMRARSTERAGGSRGNAPGPGAYTPQRLGKAPCASFGASMREGMTPGGKAAPGPGAYDVKSAPSSPKFGFGSSSRPGSAERSGPGPGPGAYTLQSTLGTHGISIGARPEDKQARQAAPGPGAYTLKYEEGKSDPKFSFGTGQRPGLSHPNKNPGPGTYQVPGGLDTHGASMAPRRDDAVHAKPGGSMYGPFTQFG